MIQLSDYVVLDIFIEGGGGGGGSWAERGGGGGVG